MPWAWGAYSACCISAASALTPTGRACCLSQYCMTIAMLAAPQPSFSCFTNGTSSQMPEGSAAKTTPAKSVPPTHSINTRIRITRDMGSLSAHRDNNQNQRGDDDQDDNQVPVAQVA